MSRVGAWICGYIQVKFTIIFLCILKLAAGKIDLTWSTFEQLRFTQKNCFALKLFTVIIIYNVRYIYV